jgi:DNA-binding response OmpR family regulator
MELSRPNVINRQAYLRRGREPRRSGSDRAPLADREPRTVLVVESNTAVRRFMGQTLRKIGFGALEAVSARDGLSVFLGHSDTIDLAIIDIMLPGISGLDLAAELERQQHGFKILYSSDRVDSLAMVCIAQERPDCVLPIPFTQSALVAKVHHLLW